MVQPTAPRARCLEVLRGEGAMVIRELAARTALSRPTVEALLEDFTREGLVDSALALAQPGQSGGRPARQYRFRAEQYHLLGLDLSDTHMRLAVADLAGNIVHADVAGPHCPRTGAPELSPVRDWVTKVLLGAGIPLPSLAGLTVALPGIVSPSGRLMGSPAVAEWAGVDMAARLGDMFERPARVENDLVLAAGAEARLGAAQFTDTSLYVLTWFHVSARLVTHGKVHTGRNRQAGEMASLRVLAPERDVWDLWQSIDEVDESLRGLADDDPDARALLRKLANRMAPALAGLVAAVDPEVVVLGSRLGKYAPHLAPLLTELLSDQLSLDFDYPIRGHRLGDLAPSLGAVLDALQMHSPALLNTPQIGIPQVRLGAVADILAGRAERTGAPASERRRDVG